MKNLAGFCYTQLTDTFLEKNGLLTEDRQPKADLLHLAAATRGERSIVNLELQAQINPLGYNNFWFQSQTIHHPTTERLQPVLEL
jgi:hypothetical protein